MEIRCPNCNKKLGNRVCGLYVTDCPRCHQPVRIVHPCREIVSLDGQRFHVEAHPLPPAQKAA